MGELRREVTIDLVLLLGDQQNARVLGQPLWAAMLEVTSYLSAGGDGWLGLPLPTRSRSEAHLRPRYRLWNLPGASPSFEVPEGHDSGGVVELSDAERDRLWGKALERRSRYDVQKLGAGVSAAVGKAAHVTVDFGVVVTDAELVPPSDWRYILWGGYPGGAVVSTAPMDPRYWGASMSDGALIRRQQVKHGTRASVMSVVGSRLGLSRCENPSCFMFAAVDNVARLAEMRHLGGEHSVSGLRRGYFPPDEPEPEQVMAPVDEAVS